MEPTIPGPSYRIFLAGKYSSDLIGPLKAKGYDVRVVTSDDMEKRDVFNRTTCDCVILCPDASLSEKAALNLKLFLKTTGDAIFLGKSGWETGNGKLGLPLYFYYDTYQMWDLTGTRSIRPAEGREDRYASGRYDGSLSGWSALAYMYPGASEAYPILNAYDGNGKLLGRAAAVLANYAGEYAGSEWGIFGAISDAYYKSTAFGAALSSMLGEMADNRFFQDGYALNSSRMQTTTTFKVTSTQPSGFIRIKDQVFIKPDGNPLFLIGTNYTAPICYMSGYGAGGSVNIDAIEADFRKASEAGINYFRIWSLTYDNPVACTAVKEFSRRYGIYLEIVLPHPTAYADSTEYTSVLRKNAEFWKNDTMVIGYDLANEPFITTIGGMTDHGAASPAIEFKAYTTAPPSLLSSSDKSWCDAAVAGNYWPECSSLISAALKKELWGLKVLFDKPVRAHYWNGQDEQYSTYPGYTGGNLTVDDPYVPALEAVNETFRIWIDGAVQAIRSADPNHFITVGYNYAYSLLDCNDALDFTNVHVYDPPKSMQNVLNNLTTLDRMDLRWGDKPVTAGEFGVSCAYVMPDGKYMDPYTEAVCDIMLYLYSYAKGYAGAANWQLNETPVSGMLRGMPWLASYTDEAKLAQERIGLYTYDDTYGGLAKPLAKTLSFFASYVKEHGTGEAAAFKLLSGGTRIGAGYEFLSPNAVFAGTTAYSSDRLSFKSTKAANVMVIHSGNAIRLMSTASCKVSVNTAMYGIQPSQAAVTGKKGAVTSGGDFLTVELYEGEIVIIQ